MQEQEQAGHVHSRACWEDPDPGQGRPFLVCGKAAGQPEGEDMGRQLIGFGGLGPDFAPESDW